MALVDEQQIIVGKVVDQGVGRLPRLSAVEVPGVVLNARTEAHLGQQGQIVQGPLLQALGFQELVVGPQLFEPLLEFGANRGGGGSGPA